MSNQPPWIDRLVEDAKAGKLREEDFERLHRDYFTKVLCSFPKDAVTPAERRELTQEVFFAVYKGLRGCPNGAFENWLFRIAKNTFLTWRQKNQRLKRQGLEISLECLKDASELIDRSRGALDFMIQEERARLLHEAIAELPQQMRRCVVLRVTQELRIKEIAVVLRIKPGTVKAHLNQARSKLREKLGRHFRGIDF